MGLARNRASYPQTPAGLASDAETRVRNLYHSHDHCMHTLRRSEMTDAAALDAKDNQLAGCDSPGAQTPSSPSLLQQPTSPSPAVDADSNPPSAPLQQPTSPAPPVFDADGVRRAAALATAVTQSPSVQLQRQQPTSPTAVDAAPSLDADRVRSAAALVTAMTAVSTTDSPPTTDPPGDASLRNAHEAAWAAITEGCDQSFHQSVFNALVQAHRVDETKDQFRRGKVQENAWPAEDPVLIALLQFWRSSRCGLQGNHSGRLAYLQRWLAFNDDEWHKGRLRDTVRPCMLACMR